MRVALCKLNDIADPGSRAFTVGDGDWPLKGFLVRRGADVFAYENSCPHARHPLDWRPYEFLTADHTLIQCASHGALFQIDSGACVAGPCNGRGLRPLRVIVEKGCVFLETPDQ